MLVHLCNLPKNLDIFLKLAVVVLWGEGLISAGFNPQKCLSKWSLIQRFLAFMFWTGWDLSFSFSCMIVMEPINCWKPDGFPDLRTTHDEDRFSIPLRRVFAMSSANRAIKSCKCLPRLFYCFARNWCHRTLPHGHAFCTNCVQVLVFVPWSKHHILR